MCLCLEAGQILVFPELSGDGIWIPTGVCGPKEQFDGFEGEGLIPKADPTPACCFASSGNESNSIPEFSFFGFFVCLFF